MINLKEYETVLEEDMDELKSKGIMLKHKKTGARVIVLSNEDDNKVFSIAFRTPPKDSTGVPHIIEHSVLCGSKEFPSKDPFVELAKGSLNTFLNAMTYSDKTMYPIASCNEKDFQNLMHVYLDAVFYPNIYKREEIFKQEGWHYEMESVEGQIKYNGVVYNEMKGVFSSPEQILFRMIQKSVFPDTAYGTESGGEPECIPDLTYEEFLEFHKMYYHPSNSYIYLYGNMDMEEKLSWMDQHYLSKFSYQEIDSALKMQEPFEKTREVEDYYSVSDGESIEEKTYLSYNVVVENSLEEELYLAFQVLEYVLLGAPGAPLKQALLEKGIGKDIMSSFDNGILQPVFSIITKNTEEDKKEEFLQVIFDTLGDLVHKGIDKRGLLAGINYFEFKYREADFGQYPKGLMYGIQILDSWLYDDNKPFIHIRANDSFKLLKERVETNYFEKLIEKYLLHNNHSSVVIVKPQRGLTDLKEEQANKKLADYRESLSLEEREALVEATKKLVKFQETPSSKEELEAIPLLSREDIEKKAQPIINELILVGGTSVLFHDIFTNGIAYIKVLFDVDNIEAKWVPYMSLLSTVLGYVGTKNYSLSEFMNEVNIQTGGISTDINTYSRVNHKGEFLAKFEVSAKALYSNLGKALDLVREMLFCSEVDDIKRLREIVAELRSRLEMKLNSQGHMTVANRALSYFSKAGYFNDMLNGVGFYRFIKNLDENFQEEKDNLVEGLELISQQIFVKERIFISYTANQEGLGCLKNELSNFLGGFPDEKQGTKENDIFASSFGKLRPKPLNEGFMTSGQVQYVGRAGSFVEGGFSYSGVLKVVKTILNYDYLWNNVRVKGGAYGCMSGFSREGNGFFASYRDPNLVETNKVYEKAHEFIENFTVDERDMTKYIIGTISGMDTPLNPMAKGNRSLVSYLCNLSFEEIQKERDKILEATQEDIRSMAGVVKAVVDAGNICVVGNNKVIEGNKELFATVENLN